eukprot:CAMPEP_0176063092 /NCGR_PEP_ID=MMETSP0120_2-20121206/31464_1 /TAXON_ID=160619 /ORGANISM="Kryptoperidinium foliaceum, Strain CCMP 1326" /LENGTH=728 /DNA_ID=CAMNT_0017396661 /DNA_START=70 /DNA_END=2252 /DNA_ORIENTATION=-
MQLRRRLFGLVARGHREPLLLRHPAPQAIGGIRRPLASAPSWTSLTSLTSASDADESDLEGGSAPSKPARPLSKGRLARAMRFSSIDGPEGYIDIAYEGLARPQDLGGVIDAMMSAAGAEPGPRGELLLELPEFERLCLDLLNFQLAQDEVHEVFQSVDSNADGYVSSVDILEQCCTGRHRVLLCSMLHVFQVRELNKRYQLPRGYDFSRPTNDIVSNHGSLNSRWIGRFRDVREQLDFTYHGGYTLARQQWQDTVVSTMMLRTEPKAMPWLVYTCGGYGTGKGFCMAWMSQHGVFPLTDMVCVDPDQFKQTMPEWKHYLERGMDAGTLCHAESAYMQELVQALAMRNRQNIWVDGSLWNTEWHKGVFQDLKARYPHYRIAIFYISSSKRRALERIEARRIASGRGIPYDRVAQSLEGARRSVEKLTPYVDFVARIDNDGEVPVLRAVEVVDTSGSWESIARRFARPLPLTQDFPSALAPLCLRSLPEGALRAMTFQNSQKVSLDLAAVTALNDPEVLPRSAAKLLEAHLPGVIELEASAVFITSGDTDLVRMTNIPLKSKAHCCFVYQRQTGEEGDPLRTRDFIRFSSYRAAEGFPAIVELLKYGGFVYLDPDSGAVLAAACISKRPGTGMLPFGRREELSPRVLQALQAEERWHPVTLGRLQAAQQYAWICPREVIAGRKVGGHYGAFAFILEDGSAWIFQVSPVLPEPANRSRRPPLRAVVRDVS